MFIGISPSRMGVTLPAKKSFTPAVLYSSGEPGIWYDPADTSSLWQDTGGTTPVATTGDSVARADDLSANGATATQATATLRPVWDGTNALTYDGVDDRIVWDWPADNRTDAMRMYVPVKTTDTQFMVLGAKTSALVGYVGAAQSGSTAVASSRASSRSGTPTFHVDGVSLGEPTRGELYDALAVGTWKLLEVRDIDFVFDSVWDGGAQLSGMQHDGDHTTWIINGSLGEFILTTEARAATFHDRIMSYLADKYGVAL